MNMGKYQTVGLSYGVRTHFAILYKIYICRVSSNLLIFYLTTATVGWWTFYIIFIATAAVAAAAVYKRANNERWYRCFGSATATVRPTTFNNCDTSLKGNCKFGNLFVVLCIIMSLVSCGEPPDSSPTTHTETFLPRESNHGSLLSYWLRTLWSPGEFVSISTRSVFVRSYMQYTFWPIVAES